MTSPGGQVVDTAYVDILPRVDDFSRLLKRELDKIFRDFGRSATKVFDDIGDAAADAGGKIDVSITKGARRAENALDELADAAERAVENLADLADVTIEVGKVGIHQFGDMTDSVGKLGSAFGQLGATAFNPAGLVQFAAIVTAIGLAVGPIVALSAALADVAGLLAGLPAVVGVLAATIAPLVIGFQNFGDAIGAIMKGDPEKIAEALGKLAPAAANVAREFKVLLPQFQSLQRLVQQSLFAPLQGTLTNVVNALLPSLRSGLSGVASAFGTLFAEFGKFASSSRFIQVLNETFATTGRIIGNLTGPLIRVFDALTSSVHESLPFVERIGAAFGRALDQFSAFLNKAIETGDFDKFLEDALKSIKELVALGTAVGSLIGTLFGQTDDAGRSFLTTLTDLVKRLDAFFQTAEGQETIANAVKTLKALGAALGFLVNAFVEVNDFLVDTLDFFDRLGNDVERATEKVGEFFTGIGDFLTSIPGKVGTFLSELPGKVAGVFRSAFDAALRAVGIGIGLILFAVTELPNQVGTFLSTLPERAATALSELGTKLSEVFSSAFETAKTTVTNKISEVMDAIREAPGKILELGPRFLEAGKNLITSFINGFRQVGTFIGDVAGDIVAGVKGFLNKAIDRVNSGIAIVDDALPGSLSRIPRLAQGALVRHRPGGILANIGEGREDEVVAPLSKLDDIAGGQNITFNAGAISVMFEGVVPTPQEARAVGAGIGEGILSRLARGNIRTQVRAI